MSETKSNSGKVDVGTFIILFIFIALAFFTGLYIKGSLDLSGIISNLGGGYLNVLGWIIVFYGIELFQMGIGTNVRNLIFENKNTAAAIYQVGIAISLAILISKGVL